MIEEPEDKLTSLLLKWEEAWEKGIELSISDLCGDSSELIKPLPAHVRRLKRMAWMNRSHEKEETLPEAEVNKDRLIGTLLADRYRLEARLGAGGFGSVYQAFDRELERAVAVKIGHVRNSQSSEQLLAEARRSAQLRHPGIVTVYDVGRHDGALFLVTELIEGRTLAEEIANQRPSLFESAALVADIADALSVAHQQGFVHRDIKPSNILLDQQRRPRLADFGISVRHDEMANGVCGTPGYMSPEQERGEKLDARSDIYSLGIVFFQLLTGQRFAIFDDAASRSAALQTSLPYHLKGVVNICRRCLEDRPEDRFETARDLAEEIRAIIDRPRTLNGKNAALIICGVATAGLLWWGFLNSDAVKSHNAATSLPSVDSPTLSHAEEQTQTNREKGLDLPLSMLPTTDQRIELSSTVPDEPPGEVAVLWGHSAYVNCVAVSPDGTRLVSGSNDQSVRVWDLKTYQLRWSFRDFRRHVRAVAFSADNLTVLACDRDCLRELDAENGNEISMTELPPLSEAYFSNDARLMIVTHQNGSGSIYNVTKKSSLLTIPEPHTVYCATFIDRNKKILFGNMDLDEIVLSSGRRRRTPFHQASLIESMAASHDSRFLVTSSGKRFLNGQNDAGDRAVRIWSYSDGKLLHELKEHQGFIWAVTFCPDGQRFLSGGGGEPEDFFAHRAGADTAVRLWDAATGKLLHSYEGHEAAIQGLAVSPDGRYAVSASCDSTIRVWRLPKPR